MRRAEEGPAATRKQEAGKKQDEKQGREAGEGAEARSKGKQRRSKGKANEEARNSARGPTSWKRKVPRATLCSHIARKLLLLRSFSSLPHLAIVSFSSHPLSVSSQTARREAAQDEGDAPALAAWWTRGE